MGGRKHKKKQQNNKKSKNAQIKKHKNRNGGKPQSQKNAILQKLQTAQDITNTQLREAHCNNNNNNNNNDYNNHSNAHYNGGGRKNKKNKNKHHQNNNRHNNNKWKQKASYKSELNQFKDQLRPLGLGIRNARSDGNCLFRAISDQISGDENNQARFRKGIVEYMTTNSDEFAPFYVGDYVAYLKKMSKNGIWGGNMELTAAAKAFKVDIVIHSLNAARYEILYQKGKPERTIHLSYHNERHYASVRRLEDMRSVQPSRKINLDKSQVDKLQREQQRAEIAWCHSGGNPLDIESAKDKLLNLTPTEQVVVARTGCYDITKVKEALHFLDGDIDAAVESIMVDISLMANEQKEKTIQLLEKQKEEEEHEKDNNKPKKKKKKKHKHKRKNKNKKKENNQNIGNKKEEKDEKKTEKKENDESKVNQQENMKKDEAEPIVPVVDLKSAVVHDEDLEQRLVKMKESVNKKERSLDDILSVKVKICKDDKKENNIDIKSDLDKKNQSDINNKDKKQEKQDKEDKKDELLDIKFYQERDTRINAERLKMKKIKCIDRKCNFQHELLLVYLKHYKFIHLQNGVIKNKLQSKKDIICPCGHKNQFDFQFCSKCGWDLRFKLVLPPHVQKQMKNVNEKIRKSQEQYAIGQVPANKLLNSTKSIVIHKKNNKSDKSNKSNKCGNYKWRKSQTLYNKYKKYMYRYWKCKKCTFVNPKSNQTCMVCSMCNSKPVQYNTKNIIKQSNDDYPALTSHKKHVNPSTNWVAMAIQKNKPKTKPKAKAIKQQKKNEFGWICSQCTFENKPSHQKCKMCSNNKPKKSRKNQQQKKNNNIQGWKCACTLINDCNVTICSACGNNKESMNGVTDTYFADPQCDFDESELKNEMDSYEKPWEKYKNKQKNNYKYNDGDDEREGDAYDNYNGNNGWSVKGNDKCRCGSGKKYKKCCKKLEKHTDKSYKNKYKNHEEYHHSHSYNHKKNDYEMDPIDELNKIIKVAERQIFDFKGKKQIKIQMIRELEKTKAKRNELMKKLDSNRNKAIKAQNRQRENNKNKKMNNNRVVISNGSNKKSNNNAANLTIAI